MPRSLHDVSRLSAHDVVDSLVPSAPALSPDGRWVVHVVGPVGQAGDRPVRTLWITAVDRSAPPRVLVTGSAPRWSADSRWVHFLSDHAQPHRIRRAGGPAESLTTWRGGVEHHRPLADPDLVALLAADEHTEDRSAPRPSRLRLLHLRTGLLRTPAAFTDRHVVDVVQRPDGGPLAVLTRSTPDLDPGLLESELHLLDPATGATHDLGAVEVSASSPTWWRHPDSGWHLAYLANTPPGLVGGTAVFDLAIPPSGPATGHHNLTDGLPACPVELVQVDTGPPLALIEDGLDTTIHRLDPTGPRFALVHRLEGFAGSLTTSRDGDVVAVVASTAHEPDDVHTGPPRGPLERLTDTNPGFRAVHWGTVERLSYRADDGLALDGLLVLPPGTTRQDGPFPLVTLVHGGPYGRHADRLQLGWYPSGQWLATAGYAVFLPNPRGGRGHGHAFAACVAGAVGQDEWTDILTGIDLLVDGAVADPDRLGIGGWSHGGFMAAWAVGQTRRFKAALVGAGISDWGMLAATGEEGAFEAALGGSTGWEGPGPHPHDRLSPISHASAIRTPVLIVHGSEDTNVPVSQAEFLHRALRRFGVEHDHVVYRGEPHSIRRREHQLDLLHRTRAWFDRWLTDRGHQGCPSAGG